VLSEKNFNFFHFFLKTRLADAFALSLKSLCRLLQLLPEGFNCFANQHVFFSEDRDYSTAFLGCASLLEKIFSGH
jgi:hypothetical protein